MAASLPPATTPESTDRGGSLTSRVSWLMLAKTISFILNMALPLIVVRRLTQSDFGIYKQLFLVVNTAGMILPLGFGMSAYYFLPREPERRAETVFHIVLVNFLTGLAVWAILWQWPQLLGIIFHQPGLDSYAHVMGALILLWIFSYFLEIVSLANQEIRFATGAIILIQFSRTALFLAAVLVYGTVRALVWAGLLQGLLQSGVLLWYLRSRFGPFWRHFDAGMLRRQVSYALPLGFAGLLLTTQTDLHNYFVANRFGPAIYALYAVGTVQIPLMGMLQEATNAVLIPHISLLQQRHESREVIYLMSRAMRKLAAIYFPVCVFLIAFAHEFIAFLFTPRYLASVPVFVINLLLLPFMIILPDPLFRAYVDQRYFLIRLRVLIFALLAGGLWFGTARFGMIGAIWVVVAVGALERIATAIRFGQLLHVRRQDLGLLKDVGKLALAAAAAGLLAAALRSVLPTLKPLLILLACGTAFCLIYGAVLLAAGVLSVDEKDMVRRKLSLILRHSPADA